MSVRKNFLITGSSTGIGEATALHLAAKGHQVFAGVRKNEDGEKLRAKALDKNLIPVLLDVVDEKSLAAAFQFISGQVAGLDGIVNNAGVVIAGPQEFIPLKAFRQQLDVNVTGPFAVTQIFLPLIRKFTGRIVNVGSLSGLISVPFVGPYGASKFALRGLTDSLRLELYPWKIHVALIEPGPVATPIWNKSKNLAFELIKGSLPEANKYYEKVLANFTKLLDQTVKLAVPVENVVKVIDHALLSSSPKIYYPVGRGAKLQSAMSHLVPQFMMDKVILKSAGLS
jgi:NAD(P)-dependent dehydrogenase (short-subunit alcohol dehydrogenase family)